jgi:hypothetical protein
MAGSFRTADAGVVLRGEKSAIAKSSQRSAKEALGRDYPRNWSTSFFSGVDTTAPSATISNHSGGSRRSG